MAEKLDKKGEVTEEHKKVRITFSASKLNVIQNATLALVKNSQTQGVKINGPVKMPNKRLRISCRRTPCGEGSKTWDNWEMTIFKRYIDLECTQAQIASIAKIPVLSGLKINIDVKRDM